jgi:hypothetical protein
MQRHGGHGRVTFANCDNRSQYPYNIRHNATTHAAMYLQLVHVPAEHEPFPAAASLFPPESAPSGSTALTPISSNGGRGLNGRRTLIE